MNNFVHITPLMHVTDLEEAVTFFTGILGLGPKDQPYGQRELMILAPDGNTLAFGQAIKRR